MRHLVWCAFVLSGSFAAEVTYAELVRMLHRSSVLKEAEMLYKAAQHTAQAAQGKRLPTIDARLQTARLSETPSIIFHTPQGATQPLPMGTKTRFEGEIRLRYPLFTGFALDASVSKSRLQARRAELAKRDAERNVMLQATELFGAVRIANARQKALKRALEALRMSEKKAAAMEKKGLLAPVERYNIRAKRFAIKAQYDAAVYETRQLKNRLSYFANRDIDTLRGDIRLRALPSLERLKALAMRHRSDIQALATLLKIDDKAVATAKSRFYPTVGVEAALKRQGDSLALNGDGYTNADRSYVGMEVSWNLFNGQADTHTLEAARYRKLATAARFDDYRRRVATEIENAYMRLQALRAAYRSAKMQLRAQKEYYALTKGRFEQRFADADELSRAIADLAQARADLAAAKERLALQRATLWLMSGLESFTRALR